MPAALSIQFTPDGPRTIAVDQNLVFSIGPSPTNPLRDIADFELRLAETEPFVTGGSRHEELVQCFEEAYKTSIKTLIAVVGQGAILDHPCPNLHVDLVESVTDNDQPLFTLSEPQRDVNVCRDLIDLLDADWVHLWWVGSLGSAELACDRDGTAVWSGRKGKKEALQ